MAHRIRVHKSVIGHREHLRTLPYDRNDADAALTEFISEAEAQQAEAREARVLEEAAQHVDRIADTAELADAQRREFEATNNAVSLRMSPIRHQTPEWNRMRIQQFERERDEALREIAEIRRRQAGVRLRRADEQDERGPWSGGF